MIKMRFDSKQVNRILGNAVKFSYGFLDGVEMEQMAFNQNLGDFTVDALKKYIDAQARMNPQAFHHVYEWDHVGEEGYRLFDFKAKASKRVIHFNGKFLKSKTPVESGYVFANKANVMENAIAVTITPKHSDYLVFEVDGETVFTANSVFVAHPGGDEVAGSFGKAVDDFFGNYFTAEFLSPLLDDLMTAEEYEQAFGPSVKGRSAKSSGVATGRRYLKINALGEIE